MAVSRRSGRCLNAVELRREGLVELLLTFRPSCQVDRLESLASFFGRIADYLAPYGVQIIQERCYGRADAYKEICARREVAYRQYGIDSDGAFFFIGQPPCDGSAVAGVQIWAAGPRGCVQPLSIGGEPVGTRYSDGSSSFTSFQNVGPCSGNGHARHDQAVDMFEKAGRLLETQGLSYRDVVRTWIYIPALLEWYGEFNAARRDVFRKSGLIDGKHPPAWLPASTGIQGLCPVGRSCMMGLMAVAPREGADVKVQTVESPRQCEAFAYGSAFSRAVEVRDAFLSRLLISGTASIDDGGLTVHAGDFERQAAHTIDVVRELLAARGHDLRDVAHATVFLKRPEYLQAFRRVAVERGLDWACSIETIADVCREDLLVEIDAMSVKAR